MCTQRYRAAICSFVPLERLTKVVGACSVAVELKELQPSSHIRSLMDMDPPMPDLDAGHISFAAIPRMGPPPVVVASASECSPLPWPVPSSGASGSEQFSTAALEPPITQKPKGGNLDRARSGEQASTSQPNGPSAKAQKEKVREQSAEKGVAGMARGNAQGSSASLDSMGEPKKKRGGSDKDGIRCGCLSSLKKSHNICILFCPCYNVFVFWHRVGSTSLFRR